MRKLAIEILSKSNLILTSQRVSIISLLLESKSKAYDIAELLLNLQHKMNRSTVYRTLDTLIEKRLVSKFINSKGETIYALSEDMTSQETIQPRLKCQDCGTLLSLPSFPADYMSILINHGVNKFNLVLDGFCVDCSTSH